MSSRAAAGRKRLASNDEKEKKEKSSSKGFFFKKKSSKAPADAKGHHQGLYLSPSPKQSASAQYRQDDSMAKSEISLVQRARDYDHPIHPQYPRDQIYQTQFQNYNPPSSAISDSQSQYQVSEAQTYFEASYQPPPPSRTHPTSQQTLSYAKSKASRSSTGLSSNLEHDVASSFPPPPSYASPSVSPNSLPVANLPPPDSLASHRGQAAIAPSSNSRLSSPAPSELPAYSNSHQGDFTTHVGKQTGRVTIGNQPQSGIQHTPIRPQYQQYIEEWNPPAPPLIPAVTSRSYSPNLRAPVPLPPQRTFTLEPSSPAPSRLLSPLHVDFSPRRQNVAGSIRSVSTKSSTSVPSTPSAFVFPGSRSGGRPRVSSKTGSPKVNLLPVGRSAKARKGANLTDATLYDRSGASSPAPTTSSDGRSIRGALADDLSELQIKLESETSRFSEDSTSDKRAGKMPVTGQGAFIHPSSRAKGAPHRPPISLKSKSRNRSESNSSGGYERKRFLGIPLTVKKKGKDTINNPFVAVGLEPGTSGSATSPSLDKPGRSFTSRVGQYPLDPQDPVSLDNDRHTSELLSFINPNSSPSFFNYGNAPPSSVLDLGCGQGHWMVDAAIAWKGYGTKITGFDMVDLTRTLIPWAVKRGVTENINFVKGNFLSERLPFDDNSFELVRLSCLAICIASNAWPFVLQEVFRVLMAGGRLELIDDLIFFPYGKTFSILDDSPTALPELPPRIDVSAPSARFTTFNIYDQDFKNPGLGLPVEQGDPSELYKLYGLEEEPEEDEGTVSGHLNRPSRPLPRPQAPPPVRRAEPGLLEISAASWEHAQSSALDMEAVFEHMLANKFGIQRDPNEFLQGMMEEVFGYARLLKTIHVALPCEGRQSTRASKRNSSRFSAQGPGLVLWPSTFIPMDQTEVDIHASKNLRLLLSTKTHLVEHALEATNDDDIDEATVLDSLWEYESFLRHRFNPPSSITSDRSDSDSVYSDYQQDVWDIQSEFKEYFAWGDDAGASLLQQPANPMSPIDRDPTAPPAIPLPTAPQASASPTQSRGERTSTPSAQLYPREDLTHIRTFRVYEAIKINGTLFASPN